MVKTSLLVLLATLPVAIQAEAKLRFKDEILTTDPSSPQIEEIQVKNAPIPIRIAEAPPETAPESAPEAQARTEEARLEVRKEVRTETASTPAAAEPASESEKQSKFAYDPVPSDQADSVAGRLNLVERLILEYGRAYDYRVHTTRELESILKRLESRTRKISQELAIQDESL